MYCLMCLCIAPGGLLGIQDVKHNQVLKMNGFGDSELNVIISSSWPEI